MSDQEEYLIPLTDQRVFGAGVKRKRVNFVPAGAVPQTSTKTSDGTSVGARYLSVVMKKNEAAQIEPPHLDEPEMIESTPTGTTVCGICNLPLPVSGSEDVYIQRPHEASLAHQVCLEHSHPPSHLDRSRAGLKYLSSYGWDPDSRLGLGATGSGIQAPIKARPKADTAGLGVETKIREYDGRGKGKGKAEGRGKPVVAPKTLDAGKVRKMGVKERRKAERLMEMFYGNEDVDRYLGVG
jgi:hypothetical protein